MARKRTTTQAGKLVTLDRAARLFHLLQLLGRGPRSREVLIHRLRVNVRGFYRDLETLQKLGIAITLTGRGYTLTVELNEALARLPFPDPGLTFVEAQQLAKGRTAAHRKLKQLIAQMSK